MTPCFRKKGGRRGGGKALCMPCRGQLLDTRSGDGSTGVDTVVMLSLTPWALCGSVLVLALLLPLDAHPAYQEVCGSSTPATLKLNTHTHSTRGPSTALPGSVLTPTPAISGAPWQKQTRQCLSIAASNGGEEADWKKQAGQNRLAYRVC